MTLMERRLQLLLDQGRYDRVARAAAESGRSVAAVIREAIDTRFPAGDDARTLALGRFLAHTETSAGDPESWAQIKAEMSDALDRDLTR